MFNNEDKKLYNGTATNATSRLVEHVGSKKGNEMVELIKLATLISQLSAKIKELEKEIETATDVKQKNEVITVYNKAIDELGKAHELQAKKTKKEWNHVLPVKKDLIKEVEEQKIESEILEEKLVIQQTTTENTGNAKTNENKDEALEQNNDGENVGGRAVVEENNSVLDNVGVSEEFIPEGKPSAQVVNNQNQRGEPNTIGSVSVRGEGAGGEVKGEKETNTTEEEGDEAKDKPEEVKPVGKEELMEKLKLQMEAMIEVEKKIQEIKEENLELEKFIAEQEEIEKEVILKEEAIKVLRQGKKVGIKRDDPKLSIFKKEWIDEVYGKGK